MGVVTPLVSTGQARLFLSLSGHKCSQERLPLYILKELEFMQRRSELQVDRKDLLSVRQSSDRLCQSRNVI